RGKLAPVQTVRQRRLQQRARVPERARFGELLTLEACKRTTRQRVGPRGVGRKQALARTEMIIPLRLDGSSTHGLGAKIQSIPQYLQQALFEDAQGRRQRRTLFQALDRMMIGIEERRLRVVACRQLQHELVEIETGEQAQRRQRRALTHALGARKARRIAAPAPGEEQQAKGLQHGGEARLGAAHAAREYGQAAVLARQYLENPPRVAKRPMMQNISGRERDAPWVAHYSSPRCCRARA